jgi:hypothetical protein
MADGRPTPRFITVGYVDDPNDPDRPIADADVVRPSNHIWCRVCGPEAQRFRDKSSPWCPTYGNCDVCYMSGPVGQICSGCNDKTVGYVVVFYQEKIIDAQFLATFFGKGHVVAKANRKYAWLRTPSGNLNSDMLSIKLDIKHRAIEDSAQRDAAVQSDLFLFWEAVEDGP